MIMAVMELSKGKRESVGMCLYNCILGRNGSSCLELDDRLVRGELECTALHLVCLVRYV